MRQRGEFARYCTLSVLGMLGVSCYILVDTFFVAQGLGANGLAALNLALPAYNLIHGCGLMLGMGGATRFAICKAQGEGHEGSVIYTTTVKATLALAAGFMLLGFTAAEPIARMLGAQGNVLPMASMYLRWMLLYAPVFMMNDVFQSFIRNDGDPRLSMLGMTMSSMTNILLDYVFMFVFGWGMFGAAFATGMSALMGMLTLAPHWLRKRHSFHWVRSRVRRVGRIMALGVPMLVEQVAAGVVMMIFNGLILIQEGTIGVAAYGVVANLSLVVMAVYGGIAQGVQPLLSRDWGAGDKASVQRLGRSALITAAAAATLIFILIFFFAGAITSAFNGEGDAQLQAIAVDGLRIYFTSTLFVAFNTVLATYLTSVERAVPAQVLSLLRGFGLIIPLAYLLAALCGMTGIWLAYPVTEAGTALLGAAVLWRKKLTNRY